MYYMKELVIFYYDDVLFCTCLRNIEPCLQCVLCAHEDYDDLTLTHSVLVYENITRHNERKKKGVMLPFCNEVKLRIIKVSTCG